jgi:hypothetical protein
MSIEVVVPFAIGVIVGGLGFAWLQWGMIEWRERRGR